ncbi:hypothetical protein DEI97_013450 [Curtobacterium sp. MCLR17_032]|uniref:hypothetical protein n=1 Tax=Curtobacterium sp. MCLR17_032 TaxID=2175650 RepID=UPI0011B4D8C0|nr:hypothetical protein [Curtobacterium sp. MCLR17_032]WIE60746.1 hypothetical protein DEI97_013450 [Curtobacterium sp. MCLR17_032]
MTDPAAARELVVASIGDTINCPGCKERVKLDWADGWRNDRGFTCRPYPTTHSDHIETITVKP